MTDGGGLPLGLIATRRSAGGEQIVNEHHPVPDKAVIADGHELTDEGVGLDLCTVADDHSFLDFDERR